MLVTSTNRISLVRFPIALGLALLCSACASQRPQMNMFEVDTPSTQASLDQGSLSEAIANAKALRAKGIKVWCVPFARDASGVEIKGNAGTWWRQAKDKYARGHDPVIGSVMAFSSSRKLPMGHVAVVSQVMSDREILVDHANWSPSKVSLGMKVVDVSTKGDWSAVRVASNGSSLGRVYPVDGFIWNASAE